MKLALAGLISVLTLSVSSCTTTSNSPTAASVEMSENITAEEVVYGKHKGKKLVGYIAKPKDTRNAPVVLVVHEWWGQTDYPRMRARMLAEMGYVAMAIDMYGNRDIAQHPKDAKAFMMATMKDMKGSEERFKIAMDFAKTIKGANSKKIAAIGYCYGGGVVLHVARKGFDLAGVASFHGGLAAKVPAKKGKMKAKIAVFNGAKDPMVKLDEIKAFKKEMKTAGVSLTFVNYPDALHGFTNPEATEKGAKFKLPLAYQEKADKESWDKLSQFLKDIF